ncbi:MAG: hypothetical protein HY606_06120, partial [Planctomycetes bacterium]|nr:hypothetical protein [Planctomycetota bacterium]
QANSKITLSVKAFVTELELAPGETRIITIDEKSEESNFNGTIIDENLDPAPEASIYYYQNSMEKRAYSDNDGNFSLNINHGQKIEKFILSGDDYYLEISNITPEDLKKISIKKCRYVNVYFEIPEQLITPTSRARLTRISDMTPKGVSVIRYPDSVPLDKSAGFSGRESQMPYGKNTFIFELFNDITLNWEKYHEETITVDDSTPDNLKIPIPLK